MSQFKKNEEEVESICRAVEMLEASNHMADKEKFPQILALTKRVADLAPTIAKSVKIAKETDEDKKVYSASMVTRVLTLNEKFQGLSSRLVALKEEVQTGVAPLLEKENLEAMRLRQAQEAAKQKQEQEEQERQRAEAQQREAYRLNELAKAQAEKEAAEAKIQADRQAYEAELKGASDRDVRLKKALDAQITISQALKLLADHAPPHAYKNVTKVLSQIMKQVSEEPEKEELRQIRIKNPNFQSDIAQWIGGEELLIAIGFRQVELTKSGVKIAHWELPEPKELDEWPDWFEKLNEIRDVITAASLQ